MFAQKALKKRSSLTDPFSIADWIIYISLFLSAFICLVPVINIAAISFSKAAAAEAGFVGFWPVDFSLTSYQYIMKDSSFFRSVVISLIRVILGSGMSMILTFLMAYPLSKEKAEFPMRNVYMWFMVFTMLFSGGLIPTYIIVTKLKLNDTIWALTLPWAVATYNTILMMNFFRSLPKELSEAASIDGASPMRTLLGVYIPVSMPVTATLLLFCMLWHWNDYFVGMIYVSKAENYPLMTYIRSLTLTMNFDQLTAEELVKRAEVGALTYNAAKIVVAMIPVLLVYPFLQKYFVKGIMLGSVKG